MLPFELKTRDGLTVHIKCNYHEREYRSVAYDGYHGWIPTEMIGEQFAIERGAQGFEYRGELYAIEEFQVAPDWLKAKGFDAWQPESAFSAVAIQYFDKEGYEREGVVVAHVHW